MPVWYPYKFLNSGDFRVFAIIQTSGRQFRVEPGAVIAVDGHNAGDAGGAVEPRTISSGRNMYSARGIADPAISSSNARAAASAISSIGALIVVSGGSKNSP